MTYKKQLLEKFSSILELHNNDKPESPDLWKAIKEINQYSSSVCRKKIIDGGTGVISRAAFLYHGLLSMDIDVDFLIKDSVAESIYEAIGITEGKKFVKEKNGNIIDYIINLSIWKILKGMEILSSELKTTETQGEMFIGEMVIIDDLFDKSGLSEYLAPEILADLKEDVLRGELTGDNIKYREILQEWWNK